MATERNKIFLRIVFGFVALALLYFLIVLLTPGYGTIVGFADQQPPLQVSQFVANASPHSDVRAVIGIGKSVYQHEPKLHPLFWPEPSGVEERADCWLVIFTAKTPIYRFCGLKQVVAPPAPALFLSISKSDLSTRFGRWCQ